MGLPKHPAELFAEADDANRVRPDGEWDLGRRDELADLLSQLNPDDPATIDLRGCTYADSTVLSALVTLRAKFRNIPVTLLGPSAGLRRILKIANFDGLFRIVEGS